MPEMPEANWEKITKKIKMLSITNYIKRLKFHVHSSALLK